MSASEKPFELYERTIDFLRLRKRAYQFTFQNPEKNDVLKDLAKFCHANETPYHPDARKTDVLIGRQEVWLRIVRHLKLNPEQLFEIYNRPTK